jgi:cytochrome b561/polyisoprenoid-binding protein YceI
MATQASSNLTAEQVRYSTGAIILHWLIALAMAFQVALGFAMPQRGPYSFEPMQLHKSVGITILLLTLARLAWRLVRRPPEAVEGGLTALLAKIVHWAFYAVLLLGPLTGWIIVSTAKLQVPTMFWGVIHWPHLPLPASLNEPMGEVHELLAWVAIALFVLHVAGALRHQFMLRDPVIKRMSPGGSVAVAMLLLVATVALYFAAGSYIAGKYLVPAMAHGYTGEEGEQQANAAPAPAAPVAVASVTPTDEVSPTPAPTETADVAAGLPPVWSITGGKRLAFTLDNGGSPMNGSFRDWSGSITMDPDHPETAKLSISIKLASASMGDGTQDAMLQGAEFFASGANPTATWRSTKVTQVSPGHYRASGTLSLKGHSRPQGISFALSGKDLKRHVTGSATIDRTAFDVGTGDAAASLGKSVTLNFAFDAAGRVP